MMGSAGRRGHGGEMLEHPLLGRLVVVGHDRQHRVGADLLGETGERHRFGSGVRAGAGNDRHALARHLDRDLDDAAVLLVGHGRASPVVPTGTSPCEPSLICQSTNCSKPFSSSAPFANGVMSAVIEPRNISGEFLWTKNAA